MVFSHTPSIKEENVYTKSAQTLEQTKNSLQYWISGYAFFKTFDDKLYPVRYLKENAEFLKFGSIVAMADISRPQNSLPNDISQAIEQLQAINKKLLDFSVASCSIRRNTDNKKPLFDFFDFIVYVAAIDIYIKIYSEEDLLLLCERTLQDCKTLNLAPNKATRPYNTVMSNDGSIRIRGGKKSNGDGDNSL